MSGSKPLLVHALDLWRQVLGLKAEPKRYGTQTIGDWNLREMFDELQEAIDLDPTQVTATLLLEYFVNEHLRGKAFTMLDLLNEAEAIQAQLAKPRELLAFLRRDEVRDARQAFIAGLDDALARYGAAERKDVRQLLAEHDDLAILRRDALRSISRLRVDQFLDGKPEAPEVRPVYNLQVHQWWNVNSMLAAATRMPSGVALNLIRHPQEMSSYFAFTIRNGGNLFVLSDVPEDAHPLQGGMRRRPDRELSRRASRNWFPYDLLNLEYDEASGRLYAKKASEARGLVAYQNVALPLDPIAKLPPPELLWVSMMFDLIVEKFWRRGFKAAALSYTAEMLRADSVLIDVAKSSNLAVVAYQPVGLPPLTRADIARDSSTDDEIGKSSHQPHRWMEERYGAAVPDTVLNVVGGPEQAFVLEGASEVVAMGEGFHQLTESEKAEVIGSRRQLNLVDATSFGSREKISADRKFIARANFARHVSALAKEEFQARQEAVLAWYTERVHANAPALAGWATNKELWVDDGVQSLFSGYADGVGATRRQKLVTTKDAWMPPERLLRCIFRRYDLSQGKVPYRFWVNASQVTSDRLSCFANGTKSSYWAAFYPGNPQELALIAGCEVGDLPDVLQHWTLLKPYTGNQILDRIDPMVWAARNPWIKLNLAVRLGISKRAMAEIEKRSVERPALATLIEPDWD